jgi:uncharacterized protein YndB with AHSA1/START domain
MTRTDSCSRLIHASPKTIYAALLDPEAVKTWRPPSGMKAEIYEFKPRTNGSFRMAFIYKNPDKDTKAKTTEEADIFHGTFLELVPNEKVVEIVQFESTDPDYDRPMTITTTLRPAVDGTLVTITCENVPPAIKKEDHEVGMSSTLENLARYTEQN